MDVGLAKASVRLCAGAMAFLAAGLPLDAQDGFPGLTPLKTFVVESPSLTPPSDSIDTVASQQKWNPRGRSRRGGDPAASYYPADLVFVTPGALEPKNPRTGYYFSFEDRVGLKYETGTLSFSGRADSLFWLPQMGWGSEDINRDFTPLLIRRDYEQIDEPSYEFVWQHPTNKPFAGDSIYLNYMFKVPKQNRIVEASELRTARQSFDRGFSSDAPEVCDKRIFLWQSSSLYTYDSKLAWKDTADAWRNLPSDIMATGFSMAPDLSLSLFTTADGTVCAFAPDGSKKWEAPGAAPVLALDGFVYSIAADYSAIQASRLSDGKTASVCPLPKFLPRTPNSFASVRLSGKACILLLVPAQSKVFCLRVD